MTNTEGGIHLVANPGGAWAIEANGEVISTHRSRSVAIRRGHQLAKRHAESFSIHTRAGDVISTKSYEIKPI